MRRSRFIAGQILGIQKAHEAGRSAADLSRKHGISDQTLYNRKAKCGRLKKLLAQAVMDNSVPRELLRKTDRACGTVPGG